MKKDQLLKKYLNAKNLNCYCKEKNANKFFLEGDFHKPKAFYLTCLNCGRVFVMVKSKKDFNSPKVAFIEIRGRIEGWKPSIRTR